MDNYTSTFIPQKIPMIGFNAAVYLSALAGLALYFSNYSIFMYGSSFCNYPTYIYYYYTRDKRDFEIFKRDATIYAFMARFQLWWAFLDATDWLRKAEPYTLVLIAFGYFAVLRACYVVGRDRTYFGIEMGVCKFEYTNRWPYGPYGVFPGIWHPMITMHVLAYVAMYLNAPMRE